MRKAAAVLTACVCLAACGERAFYKHNVLVEPEISLEECATVVADSVSALDEFRVGPEQEKLERYYIFDRADAQVKITVRVDDPEVVRVSYGYMEAGPPRQGSKKRLDANEFLLQEVTTAAIQLCGMAVVRESSS